MDYEDWFHVERALWSSEDISVARGGDQEDKGWGFQQHFLHLTLFNGP